MRSPGFWSMAPSHPAARLLRPIGLAYGSLTAARMDRTGAKAPCPVVCIGNFTLGGAGKTPTAIAVARILSELGARPAFLSRGYGGRLAGPVLVEPERHTAADVGDEPLLLARQATTVVARDRVAGARICAAQCADIIVMDDGLQNPSLAKNLSLAVVDAGVGIGNGLTFPAGPLRAPLARQWRHVDGMVLIGDGGAGERVAHAARERGKAVHRAWLAPVRPDAFGGLRLLAFAGIGRPGKFFDSLREIGADIAATRVFPDHHPFGRSEVARLIDEADRLNATPATTAKDRTRLPPDLAEKVLVLDIELRFAEDTALRDALRQILNT